MKSRRPRLKPAGGKVRREGSRFEKRSNRRETEGGSEKAGGGGGGRVENNISELKERKGETNIIWDGVGKD